MNYLRVGLDFDGVVSDCGRLKSEGAKKIFGVDIPPERFKKELVVGRGILTAEQYRFLLESVYGDRDIGLKMLPVEGVLEFVPRLQRQGCYLTVVSSRDCHKADIAREWMILKGLDLYLVECSGGSKADFCRGLDAYIDDDLDKLETLVGVVPNRYLLSWGYNMHLDVPASVAKRVPSWQHFYDEISVLNSMPR